MCFCVECVCVHKHWRLQLVYITQITLLQSHTSYPFLHAGLITYIVSPLFTNPCTHAHWETLPIGYHCQRKYHDHHNYCWNEISRLKPANPRFCTGRSLNWDKEHWADGNRHAPLPGDQPASRGRGVSRGCQTTHFHMWTQTHWHWGGMVCVCVCVLHMNKEKKYILNKTR